MGLETTSVERVAAELAARSLPDISAVFAAIGLHEGRQVMMGLGLTAEEAIESAMCWGYTPEQLRTRAVSRSAVERYQEGNYDASWL